MVGPSGTEAEREQNRRLLKGGFVALVGASAGLVALQGGASPAGVAVAAGSGLALGVVLLYYLFRTARIGVRDDRGDRDGRGDRGQ